MAGTGVFAADRIRAEPYCEGMPTRAGNVAMVAQTCGTQLQVTALDPNTHRRKTLRLYSPAF